MITKVGVVSIPVSDQERAKEFYLGMLGFHLVSEMAMGPDRRWVQVKPDKGETSLTLVTWFDQMPPGTVQGLVLETDDLAHDHAELRAQGLKISAIEQAPWGAYATFSDPDGNGWVLQQSRPMA
jgi:catechol 2,3-dioxygenase-like lactoylglutathione lyase family enzyme